MWEGSASAGLTLMSKLPRKASKNKNIESVPKTDTGGRGEKPKVNGLTFVKELGKTTAVSSQ